MVVSAGDNQNIIKKLSPPQFLEVFAPGVEEVFQYRTKEHEGYIQGRSRCHQMGITMI